MEIVSSMLSFFNEFCAYTSLYSFSDIYHCLRRILSEIVTFLYNHDNYLTKSASEGARFMLEFYLI